jgi:hypothetical protein
LNQLIELLSCDLFVFYLSCLFNVSPGAYHVDSTLANPGNNLYRLSGGVAAGASSAFKATQRSAAGAGNVYAKDATHNPGQSY